MQKFGETGEASLKWIANEPIIIDELERAEKINKLIEMLEENDDVQNVNRNYEFNDEISEKLGEN